MTSPRPIIMGILNATPDSFYDGGRYDDLIKRGRLLIDQGADWLDIGGESTRPGAEPVSTKEELVRVIPIIEALADLIPISIDTTKPEVAIQASKAGATILNDVHGLRNPQMVEASCHFQHTIIMHSRGTPKTMGQLTHYEDMHREIIADLVAIAKMARSTQVWLDPGIGFAKTPQQSLSILKSSRLYVDSGYPILIGASRKSFIGHTLGQKDPKDRLAGSLASIAATFYQGVQAFRVHDVAESRSFVDLLTAIEKTEYAS